MPGTWLEVKIGQTAADAEDRYRQRIRALDVAILVVLLVLAAGAVGVLLLWQQYIH